MEQVTTFLGGERDYEQIRGDTGPLVYPAGFLWVFSLLRWATGGGAVLAAQAAFAGLYLANMAVLFGIYVAAGSTPVWTLGLLCLSKRYHSIFVLRLFNDGVAMFLAFASVLLAQKSRLHWATLFLSAAVSVKMNALLMLPGLLLLLVKHRRLGGQVHAAFDFVLLQVRSAPPRPQSLTRSLTHSSTRRTRAIAKEAPTK